MPGRDPFGSQEEDSRETERMIEGLEMHYLDSLPAIVTLLVAEEEAKGIQTRTSLLPKVYVQ
jgi:hypothetical protein